MSEVRRFSDMTHPDRLKLLCGGLAAHGLAANVWEVASGNMMARVGVPVKGVDCDDVPHCLDNDVFKQSVEAVASTGAEALSRAVDGYFSQYSVVQASEAPNGERQFHVVE